MVMAKSNHSTGRARVWQEHPHGSIRSIKWSKRRNGCRGQHRVHEEDELQRTGSHDVGLLHETSSERTAPSWPRQLMGEHQLTEDPVLDKSQLPQAYRHLSVYGRLYEQGPKAGRQGPDCRNKVRDGGADRKCARLVSLRIAFSSSTVKKPRMLRMLRGILTCLTDPAYCTSQQGHTESSRNRARPAVGRRCQSSSEFVARDHPKSGQRILNDQCSTTIYGEGSSLLSSREARGRRRRKGQTVPRSLRGNTPEQPFHKQLPQRLTLTTCPRPAASHRSSRQIRLTLGTLQDHLILAHLPTLLHSPTTHPSSNLHYRKMDPVLLEHRRTRSRGSEQDRLQLARPRDLHLP